MKALLVCLMGVMLAYTSWRPSPDAWSDSLEIREIRLEPIGKGKNVVEVKVRNRSEAPQVFALHIQTRSTIGSGVGSGWGRPYFEHFETNEEKWVRFAFRVQAEVNEDTYLRLRFYNPSSRDAFEFEQYFQEKEYYGTDFPWREPATRNVTPAPAQVAQQVISCFQEIQSGLRQEQYGRVWTGFTRDYQEAEFHGSADAFQEKMGSAWVPFGWTKNDFLKLTPKGVGQNDDQQILEATLEETPWALIFVKVGSHWKLDRVSGYTDGPVLWASWMERILPTMQKHITPHYDIFYEHGSSAARDIEHIINRRESGYQQISDFLEYQGNARIILVFFQDFERKAMETGHGGGGWAFDTTMVEVYNDERQGDPHHEIVHVMAREYGNPPAAFNEGLAVYLSEELGNPALKTLGGGTLSVYERVRVLKAEEAWIPLEELLTFGNIGHDESRPEVSYAEAGAFVKYLIESYGKAVFLALYGSLKNVEDDRAYVQNMETLEQVTGKSLDEIRRGWYEASRIR